MATGNARVSSAALIELKSDLTRLSNTLHNIYELMNADMTQVGQAWQDGKYEEFVQNYRPQINKCEEIAQRYTEWCQRVLDPTIDNVIAVETTDVGGGSSSVGSAAGVTASGTAAATAASSSNISSAFNTGGSSIKKVVPRPSHNTNIATKTDINEQPKQSKSWWAKNVEEPIATYKKEREIKKIKQEGPKSADEACKIDFPNTHAVPKNPNDPTAKVIRIKSSSNSGEWNANAKVGYETPATPYGKGTANIGGGYNSGKSTTTSERDVYYDCVPNEQDS